MLVIARKLNETVNIYVPGRPDPITIMVCGVDNGRAKIGFDAKQDIKILRRELDESVTVGAGLSYPPRSRS